MQTLSRVHTRTGKPGILGVVLETLELSLMSWKIGGFVLEFPPPFQYSVFQSKLFDGTIAVRYTMHTRKRLFKSNES